MYPGNTMHGNGPAYPVSQKKPVRKCIRTGFRLFSAGAAQASCRLSTISRCSLKNSLRWISLLCEISVE